MKNQTFSLRKLKVGLVSAVIGASVLTAPIASVGAVEGETTATTTEVATSDKPADTGVDGGASNTDKVQSSNLVVKYLEDGTSTELKASETLTKAVGESYTLEASPTIPGYVLVRTEGETTGTYGEKDMEVTFFFKKAVSTITVKYVDTEGSELRASDTVSGPEGESYKIERVNIPGYELVKWEGAQEEGTFAKNDELVYTYSKAKDNEAPKTGTVKIRYVDKDKNLLGAGTKTGTIGTEYSIEPRVFKEYKLADGQGVVKGEFSETTKEIEFVYEKKVATPAKEEPKKDDKSTDKTSEKKDDKKDETKKDEVKKEAEKKTLPETGVEELSSAVALGVPLAMSALASGLLIKKSKQD